jgi:hypothetical protein
LGKFAQGLGEQVASFRARSAASGPKRRTASAPSALNSEGRRIRLQPQHRTAGRMEAKGAGTTGKLRPARLAAGVLVLIVGTVGATSLFSRGGSRTEKDHVSAAVDQRSTDVAPAMQQAPTQAMPAAQLPAMQGQVQPVPGATQAAPTAEQAGIVADVPLFGPTTLATAQPEPLAPAPAVAAYEDQAPDQEFDEAPAPEASEKTSDVKPEDVKPWVSGKLHLPTVHRLRLNSPGAALKGFSKSNGFSILIPDRKVTDNPKSIVKRDDRIKSVTADSSPEGAVINFKFRGPVPSYKVRLRNDYVEFFISAPGGG